MNKKRAQKAPNWFFEEINKITFGKTDGRKKKNRTTHKLPPSGIKKETFNRKYKY